MTGRLAVIAGAGALPLAVLEAEPGAFVVGMSGVPTSVSFTHQARFEQLGNLFETLRTAGVDRIILAGAMTRPKLDPQVMDATTAALMPRVMAAMAGGDDALLRAVVGVFEEAGFTVIGAHEVADLTAAEGVLCGDPAPMARDAARGQAILAALGPVDVGQACVVSGGICLGVETVQGTDALLDHVARTRADLAPEGGVLVKRPKDGQDLRVDMPAIGPGTIRAARAAGLSGIAVAAGRTLILERDETLSLAARLGLSLWATP